MAEMFYTGRPCKTCGGTQRRRCNGSCAVEHRHNPVRKARRRAEYAADREGARAAARAAYWKNPEAFKARQRARRAADPQHYKELQLKAYYGITRLDVEAMHRNQDGMCAMLCGRVLVLWSRETHIDHDHKTGQVRGLLCDTCNPALGHYEKIRDRAIVYLERFK